MTEGDDREDHEEWETSEECERSTKNAWIWVTLKSYAKKNTMNASKVNGASGKRKTGR